MSFDEEHQSLPDVIPNLGNLPPVTELGGDTEAQTFQHTGGQYLPRSFPLGCPRLAGFTFQFRFFVWQSSFSFLHKCWFLFLGQKGPDYGGWFLFLVSLWHPKLS